jgi:hypothetical protein
MITCLEGSEDFSVPAVTLAWGVLLMIGRGYSGLLSTWVSR